MKIIINTIDGKEVEFEEIKPEPRSRAEDYKRRLEPHELDIHNVKIKQGKTVLEFNYEELFQVFRSIFPTDSRFDC